MTELTHARPDTAAALDGHKHTGEALGSEEPVMFLERDQLVLDTSRPVPRAPIGPRANAALWALRAFVLVVTAMVIYTFVSQIAH